MARAKDDPYLNRLFEGPAGGDKAAEGEEEARAREALRREVLGIVDGAGDDTPAEPLDDGLIAAYLDDALETAERTALEARLAASPLLREQVAAASLARAAGRESGLAMPPQFAADYDDVAGPAAASRQTAAPRPAGLIGRFFGGPSPARRWLAATVPVLAVVVVAAVVGRQWVSERAPLRSNEGSGTAASKLAADAEMKRRRDERRETFRAKRDVPREPAEAAKPKPEPRPRAAEQPGRAGTKEKREGASGAGKKLSVLTTTVVPLSSELRDAVVVLGQSQQGTSFMPPAKSEAERRSVGPARPSTGSSADEMARKSRSGKSGSDKPAAGMLSQGTAGLSRRHIDVINRAVAPDCTKDPAACCGSHQVDQDLLNRLLTKQPPPHSVKVLHLSSRACYLTLP